MVSIDVAGPRAWRHSTEAAKAGGGADTWFHTARRPGPAGAPAWRRPTVI